MYECQSIRILRFLGPILLGKRPFYSAGRAGARPIGVGAEGGDGQLLLRLHELGQAGLVDDHVYGNFDIILGFSLPRRLSALRHPAHGPCCC